MSRPVHLITLAGLWSWRQRLALYASPFLPSVTAARSNNLVFAATWRRLARRQGFLSHGVYSRRLVDLDAFLDYLEALTNEVQVVCGGHGRPGAGPQNTKAVQRELCRLLSIWTSHQKQARARWGRLILRTSCRNAMPMARETVNTLATKEVANVLFSVSQVGNPFIMRKSSDLVSLYLLQKRYLQHGE
jgi:hypothetical protein